MNKELNKFEYRENDTYYVIEEDLVGWYLIVYDDKNTAELRQKY